MPEQDPSFEAARDIFMQSYSESPTGPTPQPSQDSLAQLRGDVNTGFERLRGDIRAGFAETRLYTSEELRKEVGPVREAVSEIRGRISGLYWAIGIAVALLTLVIAVATLVVTLVK